MEPHAIPVDEFLAEILTLYGRSVTFRPGATDLRVDADPVRFRQVVHNLIKNAQEAVQQVEYPEILVATRAYRPAGQDRLFVEITFEDSGAGLDEERIGELFEPYVTTKEKGTGLGLAIVKKIVEEHGGSIRAENRSGGGARIVVRLPVSRKQPGRNDQHTEDGRVNVGEEA
ncbi:MAG: hypothetical protein DSZ01_03210 [Gammaproteobacteria bacterium]|nr:MAG: hypothetical protein DSZ01_03210 [Gammaproteobacteria bacterium]